ncbi:PUA domain-containing protein, partial [[Eubacterium] cellulosolvens]
NTLQTSPEEIHNQLSSKGFKIHKDPHLSEALYFDVEGPYPIQTLHKRVKVDKQTAEAVLQGSNVYAPGILDCHSVKYGETVTVLDEGETPIANGIARMSETQILTYRRGLAVKVTEPLYRAPSLLELEEYVQGKIYPQSLPAMITSRVLNPQPKEIIADLNCAPGGKLSHLCQLTRNDALIYGMDRTKRKIEQTRQTLHRLICRNIILSIQDTRYVDQDHPNLKVDRCLIDPPCSAIGVIPQVYNTVSLKKIRDLSEYQKQFLTAASRILKPKGRAVYSVCTITLEECEEVVKFAESRCGLTLISQSPHHGLKGFKVIDNPSLVQRFHPHIHGMGYFIALFEKNY